MSIRRAALLTRSPDGARRVVRATTQPNREHRGRRRHGLDHRQHRSRCPPTPPTRSTRHDPAHVARRVGRSRSPPTAARPTRRRARSPTCPASTSLHRHRSSTCWSPSRRATSRTCASTSKLKASFSTDNYPLIAANEAQFSSGGSFSEVVDYAGRNDAGFVALSVEGRTGIDALIVKDGQSTELE